MFRLVIAHRVKTSASQHNLPIIPERQIRNTQHESQMTKMVAYLHPTALILSFVMAKKIMYATLERGAHVSQLLQNAPSDVRVARNVRGFQVHPPSTPESEGSVFQIPLTAPF